MSNKKPTISDVFKKADIVEFVTKAVPLPAPATRGEQAILDNEEKFFSDSRRLKEITDPQGTQKERISATLAEFEALVPLVAAQKGGLDMSGEISAHTYNITQLSGIEPESAKRRISAAIDSLNRGHSRGADSTKKGWNAGIIGGR